MIWFFSLLNLAHNLAALILFVLFIYCLRQRQRPVARALAFFFFFSSLWALISSLIFWAPDLSTKIALNRIKMISPTVIPLGFLMIASSMTHWRTPKWIWLILSAIPIAGVFLLLSPYHLLYITNYSLLRLGEGEVLAFTNGPWFTIANTEARLLVLASLFIITRSGKGHDTDRHRVWLINISLILPFVADTIAVMYWNDLRYVQVVPTVLAISGLILFFAIFKYHALEVVPYARSLVVDQVEDPFLVIHRDQTLLDYNQAARILFSISDSAIGLPLTEALQEHAAFLATLGSSSSPKMHWEYQHHERWFHVSQQTIAEINKKPLGQLIQLRDKTLSKSVETQLREINDTKSKLLGILAHDLLGNVSGVAILSDQLLKHHPTMEPDDLLSSLDLLKSSSFQLRDFMEQLLAWTKRNLNVIEYRPSTFSWEEIISDVLRSAHPLLQAKKIEIDCRKTSLSLFADFDMIKLVVRNLLNNAINHSPTGGTVALDAVARENHIQVSVSNQGLPLSQETMNSLFELSAHRQSQGLGLILSKDFIDTHDGEIGVECASGNTTFFFKLPMKKV